MTLLTLNDKDNTRGYAIQYAGYVADYCSSVAEPVKVAQTTVTNIVAPVVPTVSKPVDFIARSKTENVTSVAVTETRAQTQVTSAEVAALL